jgi:hypothetical protein
MDEVEKDWRPDSERLAWLRNTQEPQQATPQKMTAGPERFIASGPRIQDGPPAAQVFRRADAAVDRLEKLLDMLDQRTAAFRTPDRAKPNAEPPAPGGSPLVQALHGHALRIERAADRIASIIDTLEA